MVLSVKFALALMICGVPTVLAKPSSCDQDEWVDMLEFVCRPKDSQHSSEFACFENDNDMGMFDIGRAMDFFSQKDYCHNNSKHEQVKKIAHHICCQTLLCVFKCIEKNRPKFRRLFKEFPRNLAAILERTPSYIFKDDLLVSKMRGMVTPINSQYYSIDDYSSLMNTAFRFNYKMVALYADIYRHVYESGVDVPLVTLPDDIRRALRPYRVPSLGLFGGEHPKVIADDSEYDSDEDE